MKTNRQLLALHSPLSVQTASKAKAEEELKNGPPGTYDILAAASNLNPPHGPPYLGMNGQVGYLPHSWPERR